MTDFIFKKHAGARLCCVSISHLVADKALLLFELHFVLIRDANASDFLHDVHKVMCTNVVQEELSLISEIYCLEVLLNRLMAFDSMESLLSR